MAVKPTHAVASTPRYALARAEGLLVVELADEVVIYDLERNQAHCLNSSAAAIWKGCNGLSSETDLAAAASDSTFLPFDEELVAATIARLHKAHLLSHVGSDARAPVYSRRELVRRMKLVGIATAALPAIVSVTAPDPATAGLSVTCAKNGQPCLVTANCCTPCICSNFTKVCGGSCAT